MTAEGKRRGRWEEKKDGKIKETGQKKEGKGKTGRRKKKERKRMTEGGN